MSVREWLEANGYDPGRTAVALNGSVVSRRDSGTVVLREGDRMEIVSFVGGG